MIRPWWDYQILMWYPFIALLRLALILYASSVKYTTGTIPSTLLPDFIFQFAYSFFIEIFQWKVWIFSMLCLSITYPVFVSSYNLLWWYNLVRRNNISDQNKTMTSTRKYRRKHFSVNTFRSFHSKFLLLSCYMIYPCHANFFGEHFSPMVICLLNNANEISAAVIHSYWKIMHDKFPRYPPEGYIVSGLFMTAVILSYFLTFLWVCKRLL